jgi:hypothetical protein
MVRHRGGLLQRPAVLEISGNARRPKRVVSGLRRNPGSGQPPPDYRMRVLLWQGAGGELPSLAPDGAELWSLGVVVPACVVQVCRQIIFQIMVAGHFMALAAVLAEPRPVSGGGDQGGTGERAGS